MKKLCFIFVWAVVALLLAAFADGVVTFSLSLGGMEARTTLTPIIRWALEVVFVFGAVFMGLRGKLPGTQTPIRQ